MTTIALLPPIVDETVEMSVSRSPSPPSVAKKFAASAELQWRADVIDFAAEHEHLLRAAQEIAASADAPPSFLVGSRSIIAHRIAHWRALLPRVAPFYAVKSNPYPALVGQLAAAGVNFDCASPAEIALVRSLGVDSSRIIYANPCKQIAHIAFAKDAGVDIYTFDNEHELHKLLDTHPEARLVLRLLVDDSGSLMPFGSKFGASEVEVPRLLDALVARGANVEGFSFHVGSGCQSPASFVGALETAAGMFKLARSKGLSPSLLDIGGGFAGGAPNEMLPFASVARAVGPALERLFPVAEGVRIIAEPGRYFAAPSFGLCATVTALRIRESGAARKQRLNTVSAAGATTTTVVETVVGAREVQYYISEGVYGACNNIIFDHASPVPEPLYGTEAGALLEPATLFGPTCDSIDVVARNAPLPQLAIGDRLYFAQMGAYTNAAASEFNGMPRAAIIMVD